MSFALDATELEILGTVRDVAAARAPLVVEAATDTTAAYEEFGELGFFGLNVVEELGGLGLSDFHAGLVAYGFGRELVPGPWLEHLVAVAVAVELGDDALTGTLAAGTLLAGELVSRGRVVQLDEPLRVAGGAQLWLLPTDDGIIEVRREDVEVEPAATIDLRWSAETLRVGDARRVLGDLDELPARRVQLLAAGFAAVSAIGASERLLEMTTAYAQDRVQFGRPIGSFQAVKHRLAELYIEIEHARNLIFAALANVGEERERLMPMAALLAHDVYRTTAEAGVHLHGGIGFTWECPAHLFLKNALRLRSYPVPPEAHRRAIRSELQLEPMEDLV